MTDPLARFLEVRTEAPSEWRNLSPESYSSPFSRPLPESLIPLHGSPWFESLSAEERQALGREFMKLNAEALIVLEQALLVGMRHHRSRRTDVLEQNASSKLAVEEYLHIRAFRRFLASEPILQWREKSLFLVQNRRCRRWLAALASWQPIALCLPGAKIEAYSLTYSEHIRDGFGGWNANLWSKIQELHLRDEAHHVSAQFTIYQKAFPRGWRAIQVALGMLAFILILQVLLMTGNWRMVRNALPNRSRSERIRWTLRLAKWCVRDYPAYSRARDKMRKLLAQPSLPLGRLFSFMAW